MHHFHSKLLCQKTMLKEKEWEVQNAPFIKNRVLPVTNFFENFLLVLEPLIKS